MASFPSSARDRKPTRRLKATQLRKSNFNQVNPGGSSTPGSSPSSRSGTGSIHTTARFLHLRAESFWTGAATLSPVTRAHPSTIIRAKTRELNTSSPCIETHPPDFTHSKDCRAAAAIARNACVCSVTHPLTLSSVNCGHTNVSGDVSETQCCRLRLVSPAQCISNKVKFLHCDALSFRSDPALTWSALRETHWLMCMLERFESFGSCTVTAVIPGRYSARSDFIVKSGGSAIDPFAATHPEKSKDSKLGRPPAARPPKTIRAPLDVTCVPATDSDRKTKPAGCVASCTRALSVTKAHFPSLSSEMRNTSFPSSCFWNSSRTAATSPSRTSHASRSMEVIVCPAGPADAARNTRNTSCTSRTQPREPAGLFST